jgi:transposase
MDDPRPRLTDEIWGRLAEALKGLKLKSRAGAPPKQSDRDLIEAVLHPARTGEPWRDLPKRFGERDAVYRRFRRREEAARWRKLDERLGHLLLGPSRLHRLDPAVQPRRVGDAAEEGLVIGPEHPGVVWRKAESCVAVHLPPPSRPTSTASPPASAARPRTRL